MSGKQWRAFERFVGATATLLLQELLKTALSLPLEQQFRKIFQKTVFALEDRAKQLKKENLKVIVDSEEENE